MNDYPFLFEVGSPDELIALVLVYHRPSFELEKDEQEAEHRAAWGERPTAVEEAKDKALKAIYDHNKMAKNKSLRAIAHSAHDQEDGNEWYLIGIGSQGPTFNPHHFVTLGEVEGSARISRLLIP